MKKYFFFLLVVVGISASAVAQNASKIKLDRENFFRFGAKAGVNVNKLTGVSYKSGFNYNYQLGAFMQFNFSNRFGIQPELNFVQSSSQFTNDATDVYDDLFRDGSQKNAKLSVLEIPLLLNINVGESKHVKFQIGPSYGAVLKQTIDTLNAGGSLYKNGEWAAIGGFWMQLPVINFGARYKWGLTNLNALDNKETWKSQSIQIFVGVSF